MRTRLTLLLLLLAAPAWSAVQLAWSYVDNVLAPAQHFVVYRDQDCLGVFTLLAQIPFVSEASQTYTDTGDSQGPLLAGHNYCYQVTAMGADGRESGPSNTVIFSVPLPEPSPAAPFNLRGVAL